MPKFVKQLPEAKVNNTSILLSVFRLTAFLGIFLLMAYAYTKGFYNG